MPPIFTEEFPVPTEPSGGEHEKANLSLDGLQPVRLNRELPGQSSALLGPSPTCRSSHPCLAQQVLNAKSLVDHVEAEITGLHPMDLGGVIDAHEFVWELVPQLRAEGHSAVDFGVDDDPRPGEDLLVQRSCCGRRVSGPSGAPDFASSA